MDSNEASQIGRLFGEAWLNLKRCCSEAADRGKSGESIYNYVVVPAFEQFDRDFAEMKMNALQQKGK
jgi:hypothetical protein